MESGTLEEKEPTSGTTGQFSHKLGGLLLLFVIGCLAYIVLFPIGMVAGIALGLMPMPHPVVGTILIVMELVIIVLAAMILRRDHRYIYAYVAGLVVALVMCVAQGVLGIATPVMTIAACAVSLVGAALILTYFLRSRRVKAYFEIAD